MRARGFTLIELVVVIGIIAALSSLFVLYALPDAAARAEREARRLAVLLEHATAEARASGKAIAWAPEPGGYAFWRRDEDGEWSRFPDSSPYRGRSLGEGIVLEGERVTLAPHGLQAPMQAQVRGGNAQIILRSGGLGRVSLERLHAN